MLAMCPGTSSSTSMVGVKISIAKISQKNILLSTCNFSLTLHLGKASKKNRFFQKIVLNSGPHPPTATVQDSHSGNIDRKSLGNPDPTLKVPKPTISRESFWNHSIKDWPDITSPFILSDNITCFIAFLDVLVEKSAYFHIFTSLGLLTPTHPQFRTFS